MFYITAAFSIGSRMQSWLISESVSACRGKNYRATELVLAICPVAIMKRGSPIPNLVLIKGYRAYFHILKTYNDCLVCRGNAEGELSGGSVWLSIGDPGCRETLVNSLLKIWEIKCDGTSTAP